MKPSARFSFLSAALVLCAAQRAFPGVADYRYSATLTVAGAAEGVSLANFPVLVRISPARISGFDYAQMESPQDGADLRFLDANGRFVNHDIDTWNTNGESLVWVTVPTLTPDATLRMLWGNDAPAEANVPSAVWTDANYTVVLHCGDTGTTAVDAAGHYDGTLDAMSAPSANGIVGAATTASTDASSGGNNSGGGIVLENTAGVNVGNTSALTMTGWFRHANVAIANDIAFARRPAVNNGGTKDGWFSYFKDDGTLTCRPDTNEEESFATSLAAGEWVHVAWASANASSFYRWYVQINGVDSGFEGGNRLLGSGSYNIAFGQNPDRTGRAFHGELDEIRIRVTRNNPAWVAEEYATVADSDYLTYGAKSEAKSTYTAFLRQSETDALPAAYGAADATFTQVNEAVEAAVAAKASGLAKAVVYVAPGTYTAPRAILATNGVDIIGIGLRENVLFTYPADQEWNLRYRLLEVKGGGLLANVTLGQQTVTWTEDRWGATLRLDGDGTMASNIVVRNVRAICNSPGNNVFFGVVGVCGNAVLMDSLVTSNTGSLAGGGAAATGTSAIIRCIITNNVNTAESSNGSAGKGGGVYLRDRASLVDCLVAGNSAAKVGGGVWHEGFSGTGAGILNCTITGNSTAGKGGGVFAQQNQECVNSIVWGNAAAVAGKAIYVNEDSTRTYTIHNCCLDDDPNDHYSLTDRVSGDPLFRNAAAGDYRLVETSPCIDAGRDFHAYLSNLGYTKTWIALNGVPHCHDDHANTFAGLPDIGCYESTIWANRPTVVLFR